MKLKLFFLGMFAAAFFMSCNNEMIEDGPANSKDIVESTGKTTYFSLELPKKAPTYAGESILKGHADESNVGNVGVFIYRMDIAQNTFPENYAFLATATTPVTLKTTDGTKKVFVALNIGQSVTTTFFGPALTAATIPDEGDSYSVALNTLNRIIWADGITGWDDTAPAGESSSNGLILALAGGNMVFANGLLALNASTPVIGDAAATGRFYTMSNWDNTEPDTVPGSMPEYVSTCQFTFLADIPKDTAIAGLKNAVTISVQRAVAKTTLKFASSLEYPAAGGFSYLSDGNEGDKGFFTPWNANATNKGYFAAGNINKETTIFQKFDNGSVSDDNYNYINCDPGAAGGNTDWYINFDNLRVFGTGNLYKTSGNTVTNVLNAMSGSQGTEANSRQLGVDTLYLTENAQSFPAGYQDNSSFLVVGGRYNPRRWISSLQQASVVTNPPIIACNGEAIPSGTPSGTIIPGTDYALVPYPGSATGVSADTIYYHIGWKLFFYGKENLYKYYAWVEKKDTDTPNTPPTSYGPGTNPNPETSADVVDAINLDFSNKTLVAYFQGNCFYRIFINDINAARINERVLVRRNHVYDVNITKILGPGIADPNDIIVPGKPVLPVDTYISITIEIQDWHKVTQDEEVKGE